MSESRRRGALESPPELTIFFTLETMRGLFSGCDDEWLPGGAEVQMHNLARAFGASDGAEVVLIFEEPPPRLKEPNIRAVGVKPPVRRGRGLPFVSRIVNRRRLEACFASRAPKRVLLQSQVESKALADAARRLGVKIAYRVNSDALVDGSELRAAETLDLVHDRLRAADLVITQTDRQQQLAKENLGIDSVVVGSGSFVDPGDRLQPDVGEGALWMGRCDPVKRPWVMVELAKRLPECRFTMVMTPGVTLLYDEIATEAASVHNLELLGSISRSEVMDLYREAALVINTSIAEGMPNTLIESAFAGKPMLSYAVDPDNLFSKKHIGLCADNDFDRLTRLLSQLLADSTSRHEMGLKARAFAEKNWDIDVVAERYLEAFRSMYE